jgi:hypothetical protein
MTPLSLLRLQELDSLSRGPLVPQQSNGIRKMAWPSLCRGKAPRGLQNNSFMCYRRSVLQSLVGESFASPCQLPNSI